MISPVGLDKMAGTPEQASVVAFVTDVGAVDVTAAEVDVVAVVVVCTDSVVDIGKVVSGNCDVVVVVWGVVVACDVVVVVWGVDVSCEVVVVVLSEVDVSRDVVVIWEVGVTFDVVF